MAIYNPCTNFFPQIVEKMYLTPPGTYVCRFAMQLGLVSRTGVGMQKVNRLNEVSRRSALLRIQSMLDRIRFRLPRKIEFWIQLRQILLQPEIT